MWPSTSAAATTTKLAWKIACRHILRAMQEINELVLSSAFISDRWKRIKKLPEDPWEISLSAVRMVHDDADSQLLIQNLETQTEMNVQESTGKLTRREGFRILGEPLRGIQE